MNYLFLILLLVGCSSEPDPVLQNTGYPYCDAQTDNERISYFIKGLMNNIPQDSEGSKGQFTSLCAASYQNPNGCTVSCSFSNGVYSSAVLTCNSDSKSPTGFVTTSCNAQDFSHALQGAIKVTGTRNDSKNLSYQVEFAGGIYKLNKDGNYSKEGICSSSVNGILHFNSDGKNSTYVCQSDSFVGVDGTEQNCSSLSQSNFDTCQ